MCVVRLLFGLAFLWLIGGPALAQEGKGWLGADVQDVTKAEADKLGWNIPHGAKVGLVASGSPADKAGLKSGDIIRSIDGVDIETSGALEKVIEAKTPGDQTRLLVVSAGRERHIAVTLAERAKLQALWGQSLPLLMLDTGGHMALIKDLAFTPDGKKLGSASNDKAIRVWDWRAGKTVRTLRGQVGLGDEGKIYAMALSSDGRWLAAGWVHGAWVWGPHDEVGNIRLYDFATGKLAQPTATNILDAIDLLQQAKEIDTVLLFIAGHGFNDGPDYRFLATNAEVAADGVLRGSTVVQGQVLQGAVEGAKGRRILFIDTCHAGNASNPRLGNAAYYANIIAYTAARFDQTAREDDNLGHGLFIYALVEGLDGKAKTKDKQEITTKSLADYVKERVGELAEKQNASQEPQYFKGRDAEDYVLARW